MMIMIDVNMDICCFIFIFIFGFCRFLLICGENYFWRRCFSGYNKDSKSIKNKLEYVVYFVKYSYGELLWKYN